MNPVTGTELGGCSRSLGTRSVDEREREVVHMPRGASGAPQGLHRAKASPLRAWAGDPGHPDRYPWLRGPVATAQHLCPFSKITDAFPGRRRGGGCRGGEWRGATADLMPGMPGFVRMQPCGLALPMWAADSHGGRFGPRSDQPPNRRSPAFQSPSFLHWEEKTMR